VPWKFLVCEPLLQVSATNAEILWFLRVLLVTFSKAKDFGPHQLGRIRKNAKRLSHLESAKRL
jgi:hypothetical protein